MADIVVYEDSPFAQYLQEIQAEQPGIDLQHVTVPVHEPEPPVPSIGSRIAHNAIGMLAHLVEYISHTFLPSASDSEDAEFEERFKYLICTSPFLNKSATLHLHERGRRTETPMSVEYPVRVRPGRFGYVLGASTLATLVARTVAGKSRIGALPWLRPLLGRPSAISFALASSAWMIRFLRRRNIQMAQNQALRSLQALVSHCHGFDAKINRAIMVIQEIELVSRGYRLSTPLAPISRIEHASKTRRCNLVRAQLVAVLVKSAALFQKSTETLQSHIDPKRLSTLLDMYHITPSSRPDSPGEHDGAASAHEPRFGSMAGNNRRSMDSDHMVLTTSPTVEIRPPLATSIAIIPPSGDANTSPHQRQHTRRNSSLSRRSRTTAGGSNRNSRVFGESTPAPSVTISTDNQRFLYSDYSRTTRQHHTSWSASEGEESDSATGSSTANISPRSSAYLHPGDDSPMMTGAPEMTSLERLRKGFQRMHGYRREFLCELLSIRRKSRKGRQGLHELKDYDKNWSVVRDVLHEGMAGIDELVDDLSKVLDTELYTLPRIDPQSNDSAQDKRVQPFVHRLASLEQHIRGVQAKIYICNEDIKEAICHDPMDLEKQRLLELQYESISEDISMMASEWQYGKSALALVMDPSSSKATSHFNHMMEDDLAEMHGAGLPYLGEAGMGPVIDSMEQPDDENALLSLTSKREEVFEASTEHELSGMSRGTTATGPKMTRAERIQHQRALREQEEQKKAKTYNSTRMVHELKDVLGRRRQLREGVDEDEPAHARMPHSQSAPILSSSATASALGIMIDTVNLESLSEDSSLSVAGSSPTLLCSATTNTTNTTMLTAVEEAQQNFPMEYISPFSLGSSVFEDQGSTTHHHQYGYKSVVRFDDDHMQDANDNAFVEISGVGEAEAEMEA